MAGRKVVVPVKVTKVFSVSQIGIITLYTINPDKLAGWNFAISTEDKKYIPEKYHNLPVLGSWSGKNSTLNIEEIIKVHPDIIFSSGTTNVGDIANSDRIQEQLGIPVVMADGSLANLEKAYQFIGDLIGESVRAKMLGAYCRRILDSIGVLISNIPAEKRIRVYYAEGPKGLETDPQGSLHTEVLDFVGGINVAEVPMLKGYGRSPVSLEQVLIWNPGLILIGTDRGGDSFYNTIFADPNWSGIQAVKTRDVYEIPYHPFCWFDRPPGVNRIIGVKWLANLLYPETVKLDIRAEVKDFYARFYHCKLSDVAVSELLKRAVRI